MKADQPAQKTVEQFWALQKLSKVTKKNYMMRVSQYLKHVDMDADTFVAKTRKDPEAFQKEFIAYLGKWGEGARPSTVVFVRDSLKRFLETNRVQNVDWSYVNQFVPERKRYGEDRAPSVDEIHRIVNAADLRMRSLVLFLCSSGARIGAIEYLKWRDLAEVESDGVKFAKVIIYRGEPEQYTTFMTPEAYRHLSEYRQIRESLGEKVTPQSFVFATTSNVDDFQPEKVRGVSVKTMKNLLGRLLKQLGMREILREARNRRSFEFKQAHGFRKFFKTRMEMSGAKPIITEMLMGHSLGVSGSYMKPTEEELAKEYADAIPALTILHQEKIQNVKDELRRQLLLVAGFKDDEIGQIDLSKTTDDEFQKMVRERLLGAMANNGNRQKVVPLGEVKELIPQGWEYVAQLPTGEAIVKLPT